MALSEFIKREVDRIVDEWEQFAKTRLPAAEGLSEEALRDHARILLLDLVVDMESEQSRHEQGEKSRGELPDNSPKVTESARAHAHHRFSQGFTLNQMVSEYRALRGTVLRMWTEQRDSLERKSITELIRFGETMDQGLTEAVDWYVSKMNESRNLLLGVLGHDLRNPLGAVRMSAQYLMRTEGLDGAQTKAVIRIVSSADHMGGLVGDLLDLAQTVLGRLLPIAPAAADMGEVCQEVVDELSAFHPQSTLSITRRGELSGHWDAARIRQMVSNLTANGIQHGLAGRPVSVLVVGESDAVSVQIHNEGEAIADDVRRTLFEPLMQPTASASERQTGPSGLRLGLYIAREIALAHGGSIDVTSSQQEGTTFTAHLPRKPPVSG